MSRREAALKATAAGLQPQGLDLTKLAPARVANRVKSTLRVASDTAAYALGFSVADLVVDGEVIKGAPLAALLLRLKYADQFTVENFRQAHALLIDSHHRGPTQRPDVLAAIARAALLEWLQDTCLKCRGAERGRVKAHPCHEAGCEPGEYGRSEAVQFDHEGERITRQRSVISPKLGCPKCGGMGRIFSQPKESRGVRCVSCSNSGRLAFSHRRRFKLVNDLIAARARGSKRAQEIRLDNFSSHWMPRYLYFVDALRTIDRQMGAGLDYTFRPSLNRAHCRVADEEPVDGEGV